MPKLFYVTVIRNGGTPHRKVGFLAGPFQAHEDALARVDEARRVADGIDPWTAFDAFGTTGVEGYDKPGVLNSRLGLGALS